MDIVSCGISVISDSTILALVVLSVYNDNSSFVYNKKDRDMI